MQIKFELSWETKAYLEPDGKHYLIHNKTGNMLLTLDELKELNKVMEKAEKSRNDLFTDDFGE